MSKTRKYPAADEKALILKRYLVLHFLRKASQGG